MYKGASSSCLSLLSTTTSIISESSLHTTTLSKDTGSTAENFTPNSRGTYDVLNNQDTQSTHSESRQSKQQCRKKQSKKSPPLIVTLPPIPPLPDDNPIEINVVSKSLIEVGFESHKIKTWDNIVQPRKTNLYRILKTMINRHIKPNVQIHIGTVRFNCHMMVLQCYSSFFMEFTNEIIVKLPPEQVTPRAFMMLYDWMLSERPLLYRGGMVELFNAATFLRVNELINQSWICFDNSVKFSEDTAFLVFLEARNYELKPLQLLMLTRVRKFFLTVVASKDFLTLTAEETTLVLSSSMIGVNTEIEVFMCAVRWLNYDWENRRQHIIDIAQTVRFNLIPPWFLIAVTKSDSIEVIRVASHPEVKKMIDNGMFYTTIHLYYGKYPKRFAQFLERYKLDVPKQRQWIFDKRCTFHHRLKCPKFKLITYKGFLEYLKQIQACGKDYWRSIEVANNAKCCSAL